ncbi:hypothetical protein PG988_004691 [Apiospora saccharicola]
MNRYPIEHLAPAAGMWLVLVTLNAWLACYTHASIPESIPRCMLAAECMFSFCAISGVKNIVEQDGYYNKNPTRVNGNWCTAAGMLGLEAAILVLMFFVPSPA